MKSRDFCYWLQGFFEINSQRGALDKDQVSIIEKHLAMVFKHEIDPSFGEEQEELRKIHKSSISDNKLMC